MCPFLCFSVQQWAKMLGMELWTAGKYVTRRDELLHRYKEHASVMERSGSGIVGEMAKEVHDMMGLKISAVKVLFANPALVRHGLSIFRDQLGTLSRHCIVQHNMCVLTFTGAPNSTSS